MGSTSNVSTVRSTNASEFAQAAAWLLPSPRNRRPGAIGVQTVIPSMKPFSEAIRPTGVEVNRAGAAAPFSASFRRAVRRAQADCGGTSPARPFISRGAAVLSRITSFVGHHHFARDLAPRDLLDELLRGAAPDFAARRVDRRERRVVERRRGLVSRSRPWKDPRAPKGRARARPSPRRTPSRRCPRTRRSAAPRARAAFPSRPPRTAC